MSVRDILGGSNTSVPGAFIEDLFSTYVYTGTSAPQTINNGIDLAGKGGMVWFKCRNAAYDNTIYDTARGVTKDVVTDLTTAQTTQATGLTAFNSNGFSLGTLNKLNFTTYTYASWTFRKAPKFFDVVTYTGDGLLDKLTPHNLGSVPGMVMVKCTSATGSWWCYHNSLSATSPSSILLNTTAAQSSAISSPPPVGANINYIYTHQSTDIIAYPYWNLNALGATYVAYIFAHNAGGFGNSGSENAISCGSFTTDAGGSASVSLGFEPQWVMCKTLNVSGNWTIFDSMRGMTAASSSDTSLYPNATTIETTTATAKIRPNATGMNPLMVANTAYIYVAIRRPHKTPTTGTQVYTSIVRAGTGAAGTSTSFGNVTDLVFTKMKNYASYSYIWSDRLRGATKELYSASTAVEATVAADVTGFDSMTGFKFGVGTYFNLSGYTYIDNLFKRAPGFFDIVTYTGTGTVSLIPHGLKVIPELIIVMNRTVAQNRIVGGSVLSNTKYLVLNSTAIPVTDATVWNNTSPTASNFTVGTTVTINTLNNNNVAYLFATLTGISKVGTYTGNGTSLTVPCGFTTGARFIMIKCTSVVGDWYVWNSATGITTTTDPHLSLNTLLAEVTTDDSVDPDTSGFIVNQLAATNINVTSATYIFFAIA